MPEDKKIDSAKAKDNGPAPVAGPVADTSQDLERANLAVAEAMKAEREAQPDLNKANYGPFADHPQKFVVLEEMVAGHRKGEEISYRELMNWHGGDRTKPNVTQTKANAERLVAAGFIRPLVIV